MRKKLMESFTTSSGEICAIQLDCREALLRGHNSFLPFSKDNATGWQEREDLPAVKRNFKAERHIFVENSKIITYGISHSLK